MKYKLSISDYGKMMNILRDTAIIGISGIFLFTFLIKHGYLEFETTLGFILLALSILGGPIYLIIQIRGTHTKESLLLENEYIKSSKFGIIEFRKIKSYKFLNLNSEVLILKMLDGSKYGIAAINFNKNNYSQYFEFKALFSEIVNDKNFKLKSIKKEIIVEEKSYLKYLPYLYFVILLIMTILWILK